MISRDSFRNFLINFQKREAELQIEWSGGSTRGKITRICEDCIIVRSIGTEAGFAYLFPLDSIASIRVDDPDQIAALTEPQQAEANAMESVDLRDEPPGSVKIEPLE